jgi:hypothetical protein
VETVPDEATEHAARTRELNDALHRPPLEGDEDIERGLDGIAAEIPNIRAN